MVADYADAGLWLIFAAAIAFIALGCRMTRRAPKAAVVETFEAELDQAA